MSESVFGAISQISRLVRPKPKPELPRISPEQSIVTPDYYLALCETGIPQELRSGRVVPVGLVDAYNNNLSDNEGKPLTVLAENMSVADVLTRKRKEVEETMEGAFPVVMRGIKRRPLQRPREVGYPMVLQVQESVSPEQRFRLLSVQGTGAEKAEFKKMGEEGVTGEYRGLHFVVGRPEQNSVG